MRVVLLQAELGHRDQAVHVAGGLFKQDLEAAGFETSAWLVPAAGAAELAKKIPDAPLFLLDSIFPLRHARAVQAAVAPQAVVAVGGPNAVQHLLRASVPLVIDGSGRGAVLALAKAVRSCTQAGRGPMPSPSELAAVPNLIYRSGWPSEPSNLLYEAADFFADDEPSTDLFPFEPDLVWNHPDPGRDPEAWRNGPSVVASFGCVYNPPLRDYEPPKLPKHLSASAAQRIQTRYL